MTEIKRFKTHFEVYVGEMFIAKVYFSLREDNPYYLTKSEAEVAANNIIKGCS